MKTSIFILLLFLISSGDTKQEQNIRLGLLTDDYGIVTEEDIHENARQAHARDDRNPSQPNLVWQCLPLANARISCDDNWYDDESQQSTCHPTLWVAVGDQLYEFWVRHIFPYDEYVQTEKEIHQILDEEEIGCISAYYNWELKPDPPFKRHSSWILDRVKSQRGEWAYFTGRVPRVMEICKEPPVLVK